MELSAASLWEWTKLFVRDPRMAAQMVKAANLPLEVSILMIVVAGVVSTVVSGIYVVMIGSPDILFPISETEAMAFERTPPILQGVLAVVTGVGLSYFIYLIGSRMGGQGSLADIMSITAVLQIVLTVIVVAQFVLGVVLPIIGLLLMFLSLYVFLRGIGHAVNEGHDYNNLGKSTWVVFLSFIALAMVVLFGATVLGLTPDGEIVPIPLGETL